MGTYVKKTCGNCGKKIESWHKDPFSRVTKIGIPFIECPNCGNVIIDKYTKEYTMLNGFDYFKMYTPDIYGSIGLSLILTIILGYLIQSFDIEVTNFIFLVIFASFFFLTITLFIIKTNKVIQKEIELSKERLKNKEYKKAVNKLEKNKKHESWYNVK